MPSITRRTFLGTVAAGAAVGVAGCSSSCPDSDAPEPSVVVGTGDAASGFETLPGGSWPSPRFDAGNTGHAPVRPPADEPTLRWRTTVPAPRVDGTVADASSPTVADGQVYVTTGAGAFALSLRDGTERWRHEATPATAGPTFGYGDELAPPVLADDRVFLATTAGVVALHADDGSVAWRATDAAATGVPTISDGTLVVPTADGVAGFTAGDGSRRWTAAGPDATLPAAADGTVVVGGEETVALNPATGDRRWTAPVRTEGYPVVAGDTVFLGTYEGVVGLDLGGGTERWAVSRGSGRTFSAPVVTPETVYAVERPAEAPDATFALDPGDGDGAPEPRWCSYVGEGAVTAAADGHAFALHSGPSDVSPPPQLIAFTARFGEATWGYAARERALPPAVLDGGLVTTGRRGTVAAFGGA